MDLVFCGTPLFAVPTLERLVCAGFRVREVVTQPDRPSGRRMELAASPVKRAALEMGLPIVQPDKIKNNDEFRAGLERIAPEAIIVVGYGRIIPQWMIDLPRLGNLNLHASLLPKYRGAAPIQWAIANGETVTGVTTMRIDAGLDTGDILLQAEEPIQPEDTALTLGPRLAHTGAELILRSLAGLAEGTIQPQPQDNSRASLAPILKREDGVIDFSRTAAETWNRLRGFQPWPGAFTTFRGKTLHVHATVPAPEVALVQAGYFAIESGRLLLGFAHGSALEMTELQLEGKKRMTAMTSSTVIARAATNPSAQRRNLDAGLCCPRRCLRYPASRRAAGRLRQRTSSFRRLDKLSSADRGLTTEIVMGVLRWQSRLDHAIAANSSRSLAKLDPQVLIALRIAAYQLLYLTRVPARAAINESVELVKRARKASAAPFANAVLRKLANMEPVRSRKTPTAAELAGEFAHPEWLVERWVQSL